jgi:predicted Rossmann fold nucleotide-binding protein DprA/Smf involved in DNA uptake
MLFLPEAWENSGSLITAGFAYNMHKPIYAVPNDIFCPTSMWVNQLISDQKAVPLFDFDKFFAQNFTKKINISSEKIPSDLPDEQSKIVKLLSNKWEMSINWIINETKMDAETLMTHITLLEINNYVYQNTPWLYCLK